MRDRKTLVPFGCTFKFEIDVCGDVVNGEGERKVEEVGETGEVGNCGPAITPVTCLQNVAMARKQNFAGVVKEKSTGRT